LTAAMALLILSGEGYIQVGSALTLLPMLAIFVFLEPGENHRAIKDYALVLGLAAMIAGVFLVPFLHFLPQMYKDSDPGLRNFPPLETIPLSLVIRDLNYYRTPNLGSNPYLYTHMNTIGWVPVLLALAAPQLAPSRLKKMLWVFITGIGLVFLVTSLDLPKLLAETFPMITRLRHLTVASGLVVPLVVTLAAISLDRLIHHSALRVILQNTKGVVVSASLAQIVVIPLSVLSIGPLYNISQEFLVTRDISATAADVQPLQTSSTQWVDPPFGFYDWTIHALAQGMKISNTWRPWSWKDHVNPQPYLKASPKSGSEELGTPVLESENYRYFKDLQAEYAYVSGNAGAEAVPCRTNSQAGNINVTCTVEQPGTLTIHENAWSGWQAWVDGKRIPLQNTQWLSVKALPGTHIYQFRYLPLDVLLGILISIAGIVLTILIPRRGR
jgi:hypothetical protein